MPDLSLERALRLAFLALGLAACRAPPPCGSHGGAVTVVLSAMPTTLDWSQSHEQSAQNYPVLLAVMRGLTRLDAQNGVQPSLATSWERSLTGESPPRERYVFHLRPGVVWSDGKTPFQAQDFVFAWRRAVLGADGAELEDLVGARALQAAAGGPPEALEAAKRALGVRALDPLTLEVTLVGPRSYFLARLANVYPYFPAPSAVLEGLGEAEVQRHYAEPKDGAPLVLGAFRVVRWDRVGQQLSLERNPHDFEAPGPGAVPRLELRQTELGSLMYRQCTADFLFVDDPTVLVKPPPDLRRARLLSTYWLGFNTSTVPLPLRQAIARALDRPALLRAMAGMAPADREALAFLPPEMPGALVPGDVRLGEFPAHDEARARTLLEGQPRPAELTLLVKGTGTFLPETALAEGIRRQLAAYGLAVRVVTTGNFSNDVKDADGTLRFDLFLKRTGADYAHPHTLLTPFRERGNHYTDWQKLDGGAVVRRFEALLEAGAAESDPAARTQDYFEAQRLLVTEAAAVLPLFHPVRSYRVRPWLSGLTVDPFNFLTLSGLEVAP